MISGTTFFLGLQFLPLIEAVTLGFIAPLLVAPVAQIMLRERMRPINLIAAGIGFAGVVIAAQGAPPDSDEGRSQLLGIGAIMVSCVSYAVSMTLTRAQALRDGAPVAQLMGSAIPALLLCAPALAFAPPPKLEATPIFLLMGALGATATYLMARAYAMAEAQRLAPLDFTAALWAPIYGFVFFQEVPRPQMLLAAPVILGACLLVAWDDRRLKRPV